jgi:eukaryotic-like serine/threonine-protein kinase
LSVVLAALATLRSGTIVAGRYRLEDRVGAGGMGEVYRAMHLELGVPVAVKLLSPAIAGLERAVKRFRREARAAARLKSFHIVHIYDFGVDADVPFLVMELLEGENLSERLKRVGKLSLPQASALIDQASKGLAAAHAQSIVHRDVKPSNFFLARSPDGELLKVLDFGIAKPEDDDVTVTTSHEVVGSPLYMSPEQTNGLELDLRTDVWSLAAVVFRMITGVDAFRAPTTSAVLLKICSGRAPLASAVAPELPSAVDAFFAKAFAAELEQRFQSSAELASALAALAGRSDDATIETSVDFYRTKATLPLTPLRAPAGRRRKPWAWIGAIVVMLVLALLVLHQYAPDPAASRSEGLTPEPVSLAPTPPTASSSVSFAPSEPSVAPSLSSPLPSERRGPRPVRTKVAPKAAASTSTPERPLDRKSKDPLFGL